MAEVLHVSTRKGLFRLRRGPFGWAIEHASFLGDPVTATLEDPRDGTLYAALNLGHFGVKLHRSEDGGQCWTEVTAPAFPPAPVAQDARAPSVHQVWALAAGGAAEPGALWAGTIPAALFHSVDRGGSWSLLRPLWDRPERSAWMGGGYDHPGLHSICVDPRDARRVACAISVGGVWATDDGGGSWACRAQGMHAEYMPPERRHDPNAQDVHRMVRCRAAPEVLWAQHHNGVFRSVDDGRHWTEVTAIRPSRFGFAVAVHPGDPETAWFAPAAKDQCRVPVDGKLVVARTRDGGRSFEVLHEGLPGTHAYDLVYRHALDVDEEGAGLAMGSTTGSLWTSEDGGRRWTHVSAHLPPISQVAFSR